MMPLHPPKILCVLPDVELLYRQVGCTSKTESACVLQEMGADGGSLGGS